jgi:two-component system cell cycle response regulator
MSDAGRHIFVVDDNADNRAVLARRLVRRGYRVSEAASGEEFLASLDGTTHALDLVLLDLMMPGLGGLGVLARLRQREPTRDLPVNFEVLVARIETHLRVRNGMEMIRAQRDTMEALALVDPLTGTYNRRGFEGRLADELERMRRFGRPLALLFFDIDHFKQINDTYGHPAGDVVLRWLGARLLGLLRATDTVARIGGEEFCVIMPEVDGAQAMDAAERIRKSIEQEPVRVGDDLIAVMVSGGVAEAHAEEVSGAALVRRADIALYHAKEGGRNRIVLYTDRFDDERRGQHGSQ